jgi:DNA-binding transcriptional LysR family regulator
VRLSLRSFPSPEVLDAVAMRQADLGVAVVPDDAPGVEIEPLPGPNAVCVLPAGHPLAAERTVRPRHLAGVPMLMISDYSLLQQRIMQRFEAAKVRLNIVGDSSYSAPICALVAEGVGVSVVDALTAWAYEGRGVVVRPFAPAVPYELKLIHPAGQPRTDRVIALTQLLRAHLKALAARSCHVPLPQRGRG